MRSAFVDTSALLSLALAEVTAVEVGGRLAVFDRVRASDLLVAELRSACKRDGIAVDQRLIDSLDVVLPRRSLGPEIARVLDVGYVRGADCWHLATALYLAPDPAELTFLTLDLRQRDVARALGFMV